MRAVCEDFGDELVEFNVETEHVHCWSTSPDRCTVPGSSTA
jgi:REP element-mobilizing transposase RayT